MRSSKFLSFVLGVLSACGLALSAEAATFKATTNLTITVGESIVLGTASGENFTNYVSRTGSGQVDSGYSTLDVLGSTKLGTVMTLELNNPTNGNYVLTWKAGASGLTANYSVWVTQNDGVVASKDYTVTTGNWTPTKAEYVTLTGLPAGKFSVTLATTGTTATYAGNYGYFKFLNAHGDDFIQIPVSNIDMKAATDKSVTLSKCETRDTTTRVNYVQGIATIRMVFINEKKGKVSFSYEYSNEGYTSAKWSVAVTNEADQAVYTAQNDVSSTGSWDTYVARTNELGMLDAGVYTIDMYFAEKTGSGDYVANFQNFTFTREDYVETYYTVTVPTVENATATVTGATEKETTETETIYSAVSNATVTVTYTADAHYTLSDEATTTITGIAADATITAPTAVENAQWTEGTITTDSATGDVHIGADANSTGKLVINNGSYTATGYLAIGCGNNAKGTLDVNGGSCSVSGTIYMGNHNNGNGSGSVSYLTITNGTVSAASFSSGWSAPSISYVTVCGTGKFNITGEMDASTGGGTTNIVTVSDHGELTMKRVRLGYYGNNGTYPAGAMITLLGGAITVAEDVYFRGRNDNNFISQSILIQGGVFTCRNMVSNGTNDPYDTVTLDGGTLRASAMRDDFIVNDGKKLAVYLTSGTIDTQGYAVTIPAAISGDLMTFTKAGSGTLTFSGTVPSSGTITVPQGCGRVVIPLTTGITAGTATVYTDDATTRTFSFDATTVPYYEEGSVEHAAEGAYIAIARPNNTTGSIMVNENGSLSTIGNVYIVRGPSGDGSGSTGTLTVNGGTVTIGGGLYTGWGAGGVATYAQCGGAVTVGGDFEPSYGSSTTSRVDVTGGTLTIGGNLNPVIYDHSKADITIGGRAQVTAGDVRFFNSRGNSTATLTVTGGLLAVKRIYSNTTAAGDAATFTLNGGTLQAKAARTDFIENDATLTVYLTSGAIDTQTYDVTVPATISGISMSFTKTGTGTLTFTGTIPSSGTITVAQKGGLVVAPGNLSTGWAGSTTTASYDATANTTTFSYNAAILTLTLPTLQTGVTAVVTADGKAVTANADGTYSIPEGAKVVVSYSPADGYVVDCATTYTIDAMETAVTVPESSLPSKVGKIYSYTDGAICETTINGYGRINVNNGKLNSDLSGFTGDIYITGDAYICTNFVGAAQATWHVGGGVYLYTDESTAYNGTISFGAYTQSTKSRFYAVRDKAQECTIEIGALGSNDTSVVNAGIGGFYWWAAPNDKAAITLRKIGAGKLTTNLAGASRWEVTGGEVDFVPMTETEIPSSHDYDGYAAVCTQMVVSANATVSGYYGSLPDATFSHTLTDLVIADNATFAPDLGRTWVVTNATIGNINLKLVDTGKLTYGTQYTLLTASGNLSVGTISLTGSTDFEVKVDGKSLVATFKGNGQYVIANGETLTYAGRVRDETKHMDTDLGIVIEAGGKLVVNAKAMTLPGTDGTEGNDGTLTLPSVTLPTGKTIEDCVTVIPPTGYHAVFFVASDGYGYITFEVGEIKPAGLIIIFQ